MSRRRAAPGPQVSEGRIRVDAARAIAKLREYQLVDRTTWILEAIRAAVASRATAIALEADSNDVWLTWQGPPWPGDGLPRLFDELVSPEPAAEHQHLRLLGIAVNTALGLDPAYVDVISVGERDATRVRYRPDVLEGDALRALAAEPIERDARWMTGMRVHLRRRAGLNVLMRLVGLEGTAELMHADAACAWLPVPLTLGKHVLSRTASASAAVVRLPLGEGLDGFIELLDPAVHEAPGMLEIAERGVVLERQRLELALTSKPGEKLALPIRVFVDSPRLATNASRSEVRDDAHPVPQVRARAQSLVPALVDALVGLLRGDAPPRAAREAAFALLAAACTNHLQAHGLAGVLRPLADLPLLRDACGTPRAVTHAWQTMVYRGKRPFPTELSPWLADVAWLEPDDPAARLVVATTSRRELSRRLRWARRQLRARARFYGHAVREPRVETSRHPRVRAAIGARVPGSCIPEATFAGLSGEVCILASAEPSELVVLLEHRELARIRDELRLEVRAVIEAPDVVPGDDYRSVRPGPALDALLAAFRGAAVRAAEALAIAHAGGAPPDGYEVGELDPERDAAVIRAAIALAPTLGDSPLVHAAVWSTREGALRSLAELRDVDVIALARASTYVPPGRLVIASQGADIAALRRLLPDTTFVGYDRTPAPSALTAPELARKLSELVPRALELPEHTEGVRASVAYGEGESRLSHAGVVLERWKYPAKFLPCMLWIDADTLLPSPDWDGAANASGFVDAKYDEYERALARALARSLMDEHDPLLRGGPVRIDSLPAHALIEAIAAHGGKRLLGEALAARFMLHPLVPCVGQAPRALQELGTLFPTELSFVPPSAAPSESPPIPMVVGSRDLATALGKLCKRPPAVGTEALERHRIAALRKARLGALRAAPKVPLALPYDTVRVKIGAVAMHGVVGIARSAPTLHVFFEERPFSTIPLDLALPLVAAFEVSDVALDPTLTRVERLDEVVRTVRGAIPALLQRAVEADPTSLVVDPEVRRLLFNWHMTNTLDTGTLTALRNARAFPSVQGPLASIADALEGTSLRVANWTDTWLAADGDAVPAVDRPILLVAEPALRELVAKLHDGTMTDMTERVARLQAQRRMARGLAPAPRITEGPRELVRSFTQLQMHAELGVGEIALVDDRRSLLLVHRGGVLKDRIPVDVQPPVHVALDENQLPPRTAELQQLATRLVAALVGSPLAPALVRQLRRAVLSGALAAQATGELPLFQTADGAPATWAVFDDQLTRYRDVWYVPSPTTLRPLDDARRVFLLSLDEALLAQQAGVPLVLATRELELDAKARARRDRPPATSLALSAEDVVLGQVTLTGDGKTKPRGVVGVLAPGHARGRGVRAHRAMWPFEHRPDPCAWPTIAVVDDARLAVDRHWELPVGDDRWRELLDTIREAHEQVFRDLVRVPPDALEREHISALVTKGLTSLKATPDLPIRGTLYLQGPPRSSAPPLPIRIISAEGSTTYAPAQASGMTGTIYIAGRLTRGLLDELWRTMYLRLVRSAATNHATNRDQVTAHVAHAVAAHGLDPADVKGVKLDCFTPGPIDLRTWRTILQDPALDTHTYYDDGTETARVVSEYVERRPAPRKAAPPVVRETPAAPAIPEMPKVTRATPEERLVRKLVDRLGELGISAKRLPSGEWQKELPRLPQLAASLVVDSVEERAVVDILVAHVLTLANAAHEDVTDATERAALARMLGAR